MGVDYEGVGGVGVYLSDEDLEKFGYENGCKDEFLADMLRDTNNISYGKCGSYYEEDAIAFILFVDGHNIDEIYNNVPNFIKTLSELGLDIKREDIKPIEDLLIW
ncbi:hypothetical protein KY331_01125 [Candidatus Woesearchaeota archaeon]|nr:hypothetical protein [Candidatus Woesearchaeota archaeon]